MDHITRKIRPAVSLPGSLDGEAPRSGFAKGRSHSPAKNAASIFVSYSFMSNVAPSGLHMPNLYGRREMDARGATMVAIRIDMLMSQTELRS